MLGQAMKEKIKNAVVGQRPGLWQLGFEIGGGRSCKI